MFKDFNSNNGYLATFNFREQSIYFSEDTLQFYVDHNYPIETLWKCTDGLFHPYEANNTELIHSVSKIDIYEKAYEIGRTINDNIKDLIYTGLNNSTGFLFNINSKNITENEKIMHLIKNFVLEYGFSDSELGPRINSNETGDIDDPLNGIRNSELIINGNIVTIPSNMKNIVEDSIKLEEVLSYTYAKNPLLYQMLSQKLLKNKTRCTFDVMPFVNLCLMIYYIKRFQYGLLRAQSSTIYKLSEVFTDLKEKYGIDIIKDKTSRFYEEKTYNGKTRKKVITYFNYLQSVTATYINKHFKYYNYEIPVYPDLTEIIKNEDVDDSYNIEPALRTTQYIIRTPIIAAFDYLIQSIRSGNSTDNFCDECTAIIHTTHTLCYDHLIIYGNQIIQRRKKTGKKAYEEVEKDLNDFIEESKSTFYPSSGFLICKIYRDNKKSKKYDQKKKTNSN